MKLTLQRTNDNGKSTLGKLIVDDLAFYTIEDTFQEKKVYGKTRIPAGTYEIKLRTFGSHHEKYSKRFPFHVGMLWLQKVPGFTDILIHIGNTAYDSHGCILVGMDTEGEDMILRSTTAYKSLYKRVIKSFEDNETVYIKIIDN